MSPTLVAADFAGRHDEYYGPAWLTPRDAVDGLWENGRRLRREHYGMGEEKEDVGG